MRTIIDRKMKLILSTENAFKTIKLREQLIKALKGELENLKMIYGHIQSLMKMTISSSQYVDAPVKNVLFNL